MSPRLTGGFDESCSGCFLYERRGACPVARPGFDWQQAAVAYRQAEQLRRAVLEDAEVAPAGLAELVRRDASVDQSSVTPRTTRQAALPAGLPPANLNPNPKKEDHHADAARSL